MDDKRTPMRQIVVAQMAGRILVHLSNDMRNNCSRALMVEPSCFSSDRYRLQTVEVQIQASYYNVSFFRWCPYGTQLKLFF